MHTELTYFALLDPRLSPGVDKKIDNTVSAARDLGFNANKHLFIPGIKGLIQFIIGVLFSKSSIIFIRSSDLSLPFLFFPLIFLRWSGKKIVMDVPTPRAICIKELDANNTNIFLKSLRKIFSYSCSSWVFFPAHLIVQYASESRWFEIGVAHKTIKIGNGIYIDDNIPVASSKKFGNQNIVLIGVAQLADWHGYDRLLYAMEELSRDGNDMYELIIIGDGDALPKLKELSSNLQLKNVTFPGRKTGAELDKYFEIADVGVASLGLYRIGLNEASVLKTREYMSRGLPVITAGKDPDFSQPCTFRFEVDNDSEIKSIVALLEQLPSKLELISSMEIAGFAKSHLSIHSKLNEMLKAIK